MSDSNVRARILGNGQFQALQITGTRRYIPSSADKSLHNNAGKANETTPKKQYKSKKMLVSLYAYFKGKSTEIALSPKRGDEEIN